MLDLQNMGLVYMDHLFFLCVSYFKVDSSLIGLIKPLDTSKEKVSFKHKSSVFNKTCMSCVFLLEGHITIMWGHVDHNKSTCMIINYRMLTRQWI